MNAFTYTPSAKRAIGFAHANAKAKAAHDVAQNRLVNHKPVPYAVTDEQYAHAALDRVGDSYYDQLLEEGGERSWDFVKVVVALKDQNPDVAEKLAALQASVAAAQK
jgi:hypothetical protein